MIKDHIKYEIINIIEALSDGKLELLTACRKLDCLRIENDIFKDNNFLNILNFVSDANQYPVGKVRAKYNKEYLNKLDAELEKYLLNAKPELITSCENIQKQYMAELEKTILNSANSLENE